MTSDPPSRLSTMPTRTPVATVNLATLYDEPEMPWSRAVEALGSGSLGPESAAWLGTVGPDGRPHVAGIGVAVYDGDLYFSSGPKAYKSKNLAREPRAAIGVRLNGLDLSLEGRVEKVTDRDTVATIA